MAVEEGFIEYTVDVKGADRVRREFDELADAAARTGKGFEQLDKHLAENEKRHGRVVARLRDSVKALREYAEVSRKAESANATSTIDQRRAAYEQERKQVSLLADELERMTQRRKLDKELEGNISVANKAADRNENQQIADTLGREAAARDRLSRAIAAQAEAKKRLDAVGDPRKGDIDAARYQEANAALRQYASATDEVTAAQRNMTSALHDADRGIVSQRYALYDVSNTLAIVGGALAGVGIYATVVGAQFQSSFANVERTLDPAEFAAGELAGAIDNIRNSLVQLTGQMPLTFAELSQIATIGNQMGIAEADLMDFTSTIARFASVSGMSIDEVSKAFGGFMAQTGLAPQYLENLGSALAYVSIKSNATEAEILSVSREIAALATGAGLSADQVVGLAGTLAALRVPAERSRGSLETYFQALRKAVASGGDDLQNFATVVGVTADELEMMVRSGQGAQVLEGFLTSLNDLDSVSVTQALDALNLSQLRVSNTFTRMSQNVDTFREHMGYAQSSFIQGSELNRQYEITLETLNAQWVIFINGINGLVDAISGGAMPTLASFMQAINGVLFWLIELLEKHKWVAYILAFGGALVTVTGLMILFRGMVMRGQAALLAYATAAGITTKVNIGAMGSLRGLIGGFIGVTNASRAATGAVSTFNKVLARSLIGAALVIGGGFLADSLLGISGSANDATLSMAEYNDITAQAQKVSQGAGDGANNLADQLAGGGGGGSPSVAKAADEAAKKVRLLTDYAQDLSGVLSRSYSLRFDSNSALDSVISKWNKLREEAEKYRQEVNKLTADRSLRAYWLSVAEMYDDQLRAGQLRAEIADIDADLAKAQAGTSRELEGNTQAAVDNRATMRDLLSGYQDYIEALAASGASQQFIQQEVQRLNRDFLDQATALGYNATELAAYSSTFADMIAVVGGVPRDVTIEFNGDPALQALAEFRAKLEEDARAAGDAAGGALSDGFGGGVGDISIPDSAWDDLEFSAGESGERAGSAWYDKFINAWYGEQDPSASLLSSLDRISPGDNILDGFIDANKLRDLGVVMRPDAYTAGSEIMQAFNEGMRVSADPNGVIRAKIATGQELTQGEIYSLARRQGGAFTEEFMNSVDPTGAIRDRIVSGAEPTAAQMAALAAAIGTDFDASLLENIDPIHNILVRIGEGKDLTNEAATTLAEENGYYYNAAIAGEADPISKILAKIVNGEGITNDEATLLASANASSYNAGIASRVDVSTPIQDSFTAKQSSINAAARNSGSGAGRTWWDEFVSFWNFEWLFGQASASGKATGSAASAKRGYATGGYTGDMSRTSIAGVVHGREYVIPSWGVDQRTRLPKIEYVESLRRGTPAPRGNGAAGYANGGFVGGGGTMELGEYTINRLGRQVTVGLRVDRQELATAASGGDARLARRGSN